MPNLRTKFLTVPPRPIEWLSDNGSPYTAEETRALARDIGLVPCTTPIEGPQSNGMAEAFVKLIKRDYARVSPRPDAASCYASSPREFRKQVMEKATEAVGAVRRPHESSTATEAIGSRPSAAQSAVARSASLDASAAVDHS